MASDILYTFLYDWADRILNTELSLGITIVQSHQDIPTPEKENPYIVIDYAPNKTKIGSASGGDTDSNGDRTLVNDYGMTVELWEVNGEGGLLHLLLDSLDRQVIKDLWYTNKFSYMSEGQIIAMPREREGQWVRESLVEIVINTPEQTEDSPSYIGEVEFTGTLPAQGRSGNHIVTNT